MTRIFLFSAIILSACSLQAQRTIKLNNPSFEDFPRHSHTPRGWYDCGFTDESPPDIHPEMSGGQFSVNQIAQHQKTYLGMVVRDNETWESVAQRLSAPLQQGQCYDFSIHVARSMFYKSLSRVTNEEANYATPCKLRVWAGNGYCDRAQLLGETDKVINSRWLKKNLRFKPDADYYYILFEVYFETPVLFPYNGNILLDNASDIVPVSCGDELPPAEIVEIEQEELPAEPPVSINRSPRDREPRATPPLSNTTNRTPLPPKEDRKQPQVIVKENPPQTKPKLTPTIKGLERDRLTTGQKIRLDRLYFQADKAEIQTTSYSTLDEVYEFLRENEDVTIEVGGHTNGIPEHWFCDSLSNLRARAVAQYLVRKGITPKRVQYKGYGKRQLIASDKTLAGRKRNQRVEIKILSIDG
ncbi:MAG: OmpA family protein [Bacteroidota bacterium]